MKSFAVLGDPIEHSKSPAMHNAAFAAMGLPHRYDKFRVAQGELAEWLRKPFAGLNLTVPLKQAALPLLDELSPAATRIGAVNTVVFSEGRTRGENTDGPGFLRGLAEVRPQPVRRAVVLGGGGASRAVVDALRDLDVRWLSRDPSRLPDWGPKRSNYDGLDLTGVDLLVNTTTVGMRHGPTTWPAPLPLDELAPDAAVVDLVYPRPPGGLLDRAEALGRTVQDGLPMLLWQGVLALELWLQIELSPETVSAMRQALNKC